MSFVALLELVVVLTLALLIVVPATCGALTVRSVRRANRLVPRRRTLAPTSWLWSWREPARLHRRLRRAVHRAQAAVAPLEPPARRWRRTPATSALTVMAGDLTERALAVDDALVAAAGMRPLMPALARQVQDVELSSWQLAGTAASWRVQLHQAALAQPLPELDLGSRLEAFQAAMAELSHLSSAR